MNHHGAPGEAEREPFAELERQGIARGEGPRIFTLAVPEGDFLPAEPGGVVWVAQDPATGPGVHILLGWRGLRPVAARVNGGAATVVTLAGRWTLPVAGGWREWLARTRDERAPDPVDNEAMLRRRLEHGATLPVVNSEDAAALLALAEQGVAHEVPNAPRMFVGR